MNKGKKILIGIGIFFALVVIAVVAGILNGKSQGLSMNDMIVDAYPDIIWKEDDKMGIVNLDLDGTKSKKSINYEYSEKVADYVNHINKSDLKDYSYIHFVGNVKRDDIIECTITADLSIDFIKSAENVSSVEVEKVFTDWRVPKALKID